MQVDIPGPKKKPAGAGSPKTPPKSRRLKLPKPGIGHNGGPPLEDPPELPKRDPGTTEGRNRVAKRMARWLLTALSRAPDPRIRLVAHAIQAVGWLTGAFDPIETYLDEPKSLDELRRAVEGEKGRRGTDVHHIVEKEAAYQDGFTTRQIEGPANLVRIPRYKHHEINGWYQRRNPDFDGLSPRNYLRGRSWNERFEVGLDALVEQGVLKP